MSKLYSFSKIYHLTITVVLFLAISIIGTFLIVSEYRNHANALKSIQNDMVAERKAEVKALIIDLVESIEYQKNRVEDKLRINLKNYTEIAWNIADTIYRKYKDRLSEKEIRQLVITALIPIRCLDGRGYFWIHDTDYNLVAHPFRQKSIGGNDADLTDRIGQKIIRLFVNAALSSPEGGFVSYYWNKPGVDENYHLQKGQKKIAHLRLFKPFNWVIGIGEYVADSNLQLQREVVKQIATIHHGPKGYVFTHTSEGVCLNHINKKIIGRNRWEQKSDGGLKLIQELDRVGRRPGGGFLEYTATMDPVTGMPARKISYVLAVKDWGWVVGSGVYMKDIEKRMQVYRQDLLRELRNKIATTLVLLFCVLVVGFLVGRLLFRGLLKELNLFVAQSSDGKVGTIDVDQFKIKELRIIAQQATLLEVEKERVQTELNRAKRMESIGLMAGGVAHDLNNILSGIVGYPEILLNEIPEDSELRESIEAIRESGQRAATVVADLLTVARGAASVRVSRDLNELIEEYFESPECKKMKSLYPDIECCHELQAARPEILCSPVHIKKCLMNLAMNATESISGKGKIIFSTHNIQVTAGEGEKNDLPEGEYVVISVRDTGAGISSKDLAHIFEPFYTRKVMGKSGTGLGLTVVWNTMEDHNGKIFVQSDEHGTTFRLYFPVIGKKSVVHSAPVLEEEINHLGGSILVVDDEFHLRKITASMLQSLGCKVYTASSGESAIEVLRTTSVNLVLLDMIMDPGMNGRKTYEEIIKLYPGQKAIIVSGFSESEDVKAAIRLGAGGFLKKPFSMSQLAHAVKKGLG